MLTGYLVIGAAFFRSIDDELAKASFTDIILFEFGTLATIGEDCRRLLIAFNQSIGSSEKDRIDDTSIWFAVHFFEIENIL